MSRPLEFLRNRQVRLGVPVAGALLAAAALAATASVQPVASAQVAEVAIQLGDTIAVSGVGASVSGNTVTIASGGTYRISGALSDGQVQVAAPRSDHVTLVLDGASISSSTSAPLVIASADNATIVLADGTDNRLTDAPSRLPVPTGVDEPNAALYSSVDLTISGNGALAVDGRYNDGIASKDDLNLENGTITVTAVGDAIRGRDSLTINGGTLAVQAGADGLKSSNDEDPTKGLLTVRGGTITVSAADDGVHAETVLEISGGDLNVVQSYEGLEGKQITINDGRIVIRSTDDGINAAGGVNQLFINGGYVVVNTGGDGLDANGTITMTGGAVFVDGPTASGNGALDYDRSFTISGGTLVATGSAGMTQAPSTSSSQSSLLVYLPTVQAAGSTVAVATQDGQQLVTWTPSKAYQSVVVSTPNLQTGATYVASVGGADVARMTVAGSVTTAGASPGGFGRGARR